MSIPQPWLARLGGVADLIGSRSIRRLPGRAVAIGAGVVVGTLVAVAVVALTVPFAAGPSGAGEAQPLTRAVRVTTTLPAPPPPPPLVVHVAGAVARPGLVEVPDGARVADAIAAAGGLRPDADDSRLNLAERLGDGSRLHVATLGEADPPPPLSGGSAPAVAATPGVGARSAGGAAPDPVDLNTADEQALDTLPGIGPATAAAIVAHRSRNGPFPTVDALAEVRGIGPAKLETLRPLVRV